MKIRLSLMVFILPLLIYDQNIRIREGSQDSNSIIIKDSLLENNITSLISQFIRLDSLIDEKDGWYLIVLKSNNEIIDTFSESPFKIKLIDTYFSDSTISYIYETPLHIGYDKWMKTDTGWVWSWTSGMLQSNPNEITSAVSKYYRGYQKVIAKIISDDKVYLKIGDRETIKDCNDFKLEREAKEREYQEWFIKEEAKKKKKKREKN